MKIDFEKLPCYTDIRKSEKREMNVKYDFANEMYIYGGGVAMGALALKIYNAQGETEYTEQECQLMQAYINNSQFSPIFIESLTEILKGE